jgi:hypothetical protein
MSSIKDSYFTTYKIQQKQKVYILSIFKFLYILSIKLILKKMKNIHSVSAQDSLEKVMEISASNTCNRGLSCCRVTPVILEDELKKIEQYFQEKFSISPQELYSEYLQQIQYLGREFFSPKAVDGKCVFFKQTQVEPDHITKRGLFRISCLSGLPRNKVGSCSINEVKPLLCKIYSCGVRNITEWFEFNYIAKGNPESEQLFKEKMANDRYTFLSGLD